MASAMIGRILVDHACALQSGKRGAGGSHLALDDFIFTPAKSAALVRLDDALVALAHDARKARVVELRYFGGLSVEETAEVLAVHPNTVVRDRVLQRPGWPERSEAAQMELAKLRP
jgi:RNA polymerase sigma-70 factor, ECF subfamily